MQTPEILPPNRSAPTERPSSSEELLPSNRHCLTCPHTQTLSKWEERHKKDQEIIASRDNEIVELKGTIRSLKVFVQRGTRIFYETELGKNTRVAGRMICEGSDNTVRGTE